VLLDEVDGWRPWYITVTCGERSTCWCWRLGGALAERGWQRGQVWSAAGRVGVAQAAYSTFYH
jgi:hypothetical protein